MPRTDRFRRVLLVSISAAALTACSGSSGTDHAKTSAPMPPITEMDTAANAPVPQSAALSESDTLTPVMLQATGGSTEDRLARLEQSVTALQGDYQRIMPAFASLNTTNARIQTLLDEIEKEKGKTVAAAAPVVAPEPSVPVTTVTTTKTPALKTETIMMEETVPAKGVIPAPGTVSKANAEPVKTVTSTTTTVMTDAASAPPLSSFKEQPSAEEARTEAARQTAAAPAAGGETSVTGVRIGEHGSKTRLVFDLSAKTKPAFKYDLDNAEKLLLVEMPSSGWAGSPSGKPKSPLIESWSVSKGAEGGSSVAIQLKKDARVISTEFLKAEGKDPARLVVDIAPQG